MKRKRLTPLRIALILAVGLSIIRFNGRTMLQALDARAVDLRITQRGVQETAPEVVIVAVDDLSLEQVGRWPWSRATVARLLDNIVEADPAVIGFDIVQSESTAVPVMQGLRERIEGVDEETWARVREELGASDRDDRILAHAVRASGRTVLGYFFDFDRPTHGRPLPISHYNAVQRSGGNDGEWHVPRGGNDRHSVFDEYAGSDRERSSAQVAEPCSRGDAQRRASAGRGSARIAAGAD